LVILLCSVLFLLTSNLFAAQALVQVLEAPLFSVPDQDSPVIQYLRKGDKIFIDNTHLRKEISSTEELEISKQELAKYNKLYPDSFITNKINETPRSYIKTIDRLGRTAYILREHIAILYHDSRELSEKPLKYDPTDYRIEEPLPKDYPLKKPYQIPYEGILSLGYINKNDRAYNYTEGITKSTLAHGYTLGAVWSRKKNRNSLFYSGYQFNLKLAESRYALSTRSSQEKETRFGLGIYAHWIFFEKKNFRLNLAGGARLNVWDNKRIAQTEIATNQIETRSFNGPSVTGHIGVFYQQKKALGDQISFLIGYDIAPTIPLSQKSDNSAANTSWWQESAGERLGANLTIEQSLYFGLLFKE